MSERWWKCPTCESEITKSTNDWRLYASAHETLLHDNDALRAENARLRGEVERLRDLVKRRHRKPTHGPCCTCQRCGLDHDSCRCDLDDAVEESEAARARVRALEEGLRDCVAEIHRHLSAASAGDSDAWVSTCEGLEVVAARARALLKNADGEGGETNE